MPKYTGASKTPTDIVVTAVLNTEANTITYTMVAPDGTTATNTQDSSLPATDSANITALVRQLQAANVNVGNPRDFANALKAAASDAQAQSDRAAAAATATNTSVPDNPNPPPPVNLPADTAPVATATPVETPEPIIGTNLEPVIDEANLEPQAITNEDPFEQQRIEAQARFDNEQVGLEDTIIGADDPFEQQRLEAQQRFNDEQVVNIDPADIGEEDPFEAQRIEAEQQLNRDELLLQENPETVVKGLTGPLQDTQSQATRQDVANYMSNGDWRVKLKLAPNANYLYKAQDPGILLPLQQSDGVIFPYTPSININYAANYDAQDLTHNNYKVLQYRNSSVDQVTLTCDFTAQDTFEANYVLAVIHFFRSVTKMFFGQDENPALGVPPPLCYISGLGSFQFDNHPLVITNFSYNLPNDVDYIRAGSATNNAGVNLSAYNQRNNTNNSSQNRLGPGITTGGQTAPPNFQMLTNKEPTYVPTKIQIQINAMPVVSRNNLSNKFSLRDYASGKLLRGSKLNTGGFW